MKKGKCQLISVGFTVAIKRALIDLLDVNILGEGIRLVGPCNEQGEGISTRVCNVYAVNEEQGIYLGSA